MTRDLIGRSRSCEVSNTSLASLIRSLHMTIFFCMKTFIAITHKRKEVNREEELSCFSVVIKKGM
jgi:hypothetical protein